MSHHDTATNTELNQEELDANSKADTLALFSLVVIVVVMAIYYVS